MPKIELSADGKHYIIHALGPDSATYAAIAHRIGSDETAVEIDIALAHRLLRKAMPWYKRWWFWRL